MSPVVTFEPANGGLDQDSHPRLVRQGRAVLLDNLLVDRPGVMRQRGPVCEGTAWDNGSPIGPMAMLPYGDKVILSTINTALAAPTGLSGTGDHVPSTLPASRISSIAGTPSTPYYYRVAALAGGGETVPGPEVAAYPQATVYQTTTGSQNADYSQAGSVSGARHWYVQAQDSTGKWSQYYSLGGHDGSGYKAVFNFHPFATGAGGGATVTKVRIWRELGSVAGTYNPSQYFDLAGNATSFTDTGTIAWSGGAAGSFAALGQSGQLNLAWATVAGASGYRIYRGTTSGGENQYFDVVGAGTVSFTDTGSIAWTAGTPQTSSTATSGASRDTWVAPYRRATNAAQLRTLSTTLRVVDVANNSSSTISGITADQVPGIAWTRAGGNLYGISGDATATVTQGGFVFKKTKLIRTNGGGPSSYTNAPQAAQAIAAHYNRLFVLGGIRVGGTAIEFNTLYWSDQLPTDGSALPDTAATWQDDVTGIVNFTVVGTDDPDDFGVALAHVGTNLLVLKRRSTYMLYGNSPSNFSVRLLSNEIGCIDPRSVVEYAGGVFWMSERGFMFYDGTEVHDVSDGVRSTLVANARNQVGAAGVDGGFCRAWDMGRGYIAVQTGAIDANTSAATTDDSVYLFYVPTGVWTCFKITGMSVTQAGGRTLNNTYLVGNQRVIKANYITEPQNAPQTLLGFDTLDGDATRGFIQSKWTTRTQVVQNPLTQVQLRRCVLDYEWGLVGEGRGWQVTVKGHRYDGTEDKTVVLGRTDGDNFDPSLVAREGRRGSFDIFTETDEVHVEIIVAGSPDLSRYAIYPYTELHGAYVEYEAARRTAPASY